MSYLFFGKIKLIALIVSYCANEYTVLVQPCQSWLQPFTFLLDEASGVDHPERMFNFGNHPFWSPF